MRCQAVPTIACGVIPAGPPWDRRCRPLLAGVRTEEAGALRWDHVVAWTGGQWRPVTEVGFEHEQVTVFVWRSQRSGGDTKTPRSRRTLALPRRCVTALRDHEIRQTADRLAAGPLWQDHDLMFASTVGTSLDDHNVRRDFRNITESACRRGL